MKQPSTRAVVIAAGIGLLLLWFWPRHRPSGELPQAVSAGAGTSRAPSGLHATLAVRVRTGQSPVGAARVSVEARDARPLGLVTAGITGADGVVVLERVPFGPWRLRVTHSELAPHERAIDVAAEHMELEVTLERGVRIEGVVLDRERRPLAQATVRALSESSNADLGRALTGSDGGFVIAGLNVGVYRLHAHAVRYRPGSVGPIRLARHGQSEKLEIVLEEGRVIAGVVVDREGRPVSQARLGAASEGSSIVTADEQGRFELVGLGDDPVNIYAVATGYGPTHLSDMRPGARGVRIVLERAATLEGSVELAAPAARLMVSLCRHDERIDDELCVARRLYEPPETRFALEELPTGSFDVVLEADGHRVARVPVRLSPGENFTVPLVSLVAAP